VDGTAGNTTTSASGRQPVSVTISSNGILFVTELYYNLIRSVTGSGLTPVTSTSYPGVTTEAATAITATGATLNANVYPNGSPATVYFQWGVTTSYGNETGPVILSTDLNCSTAVALPLSGLPPNTVIYFQAVAYNNGGTSYGANLLLQTLAIEPAVITLPADVTSDNVTFNAMVDPNNSPTTVYFEWGMTPNYGTNTTSVILSSNLTGSCAVAMLLTGVPLMPVIHFQAVAFNSAGISYGGDVTYSEVGSGSSSLGAVPTFDAVAGAGSLLAVSTNTSGCVTNSDVWITNTMATTTTNGTVISFSIAGGSPGLAYDVFATPALTMPLTNGIWTWMGQGYPCVNYSLPGLTNSAVFLLLGTPQDSYGNGLTDAYELLVLHNNPANTNSGDGMLAGWKVLWGMNPLINNTAQPSERANFVYDGTGRLESLSGTNFETFNFDAEGNITNDLP
jgi:hypothetical protein